MNSDKLEECPRCGSDACYTQKINEDITNYMCYGCGFQSNSLMKSVAEFLKETSETLPELYKDLIFEDKGGQSWLPSTINLPKQGMVFTNGSKANNWKWAAVLAVPVEEDEKEKYPIPNKEGEYYEWRMDMENMKEFDETDYIEALDYIGIFKPENE